MIKLLRQKRSILQKNELSAIIIFDLKYYDDFMGGYIYLSMNNDDFYRDKIERDTALQ